ncbi:MAG TPA: hypothetical protein VE010_20920 [Thermoanaerobaculia bacterium]|nr:hypothetical protein [Thermoanaerobaculia bacterium]
MAAAAPSSRAHYVENERNWPIQHWRIGRRKDDGPRVELLYWVKRGNGYSHSGYEEEVYITVDRPSGQPRVTGFGAIY